MVLVSQLGSNCTFCTTKQPSTTAKIAMACPEIKGVVYTAGDTVTMERLASIVEDVSEKKVRRVLKTVPQLKEELKADPENGMLKYQIVFGEGVGVSWDKAGTFNATRGIETETVDEWARKNLLSTRI